MRSLPTCYFLTAAVFGLSGMIWGIQMSASGDHTLAPAHGHLNLIGFVAMAVFGTYYALTPRAAAFRIAWVHYALTVLAVVIMVPGIAMAINGQGETAAKLGSIAALLSMGLFIYVVARNGVGAGFAASDALAPVPRPDHHPAE